jgi:hypothetical protein
MLSLHFQHAYLLISSETNWGHAKPHTNESYLKNVAERGFALQNAAECMD